MKLYDKVQQEGLTYMGADILVQLKEDSEPIAAITRPEWDGFHFYTKDGRYAILFKDGHVETDMKDKCWDKDKQDWIVVRPTEEAINILKQNNYI